MVLVPIIMLTGLDDGDSVQRAFDVGATDFISKPINWTLLRFRIRYVLRSAQVMKELTRNKESLSMPSASPWKLGVARRR
jgi:PleD family two-component response regulator